MPAAPSQGTRDGPGRACCCPGWDERHRRQRQLPMGVPARAVPPRLTKVAGGAMPQADRSVLAKICAVPPAAAQCLKERRSVSVTIGLGLNEVHRGLLVGLFRGQEREKAAVAGLKLV